MFNPMAIGLSIENFQVLTASGRSMGRPAAREASSLAVLFSCLQQLQCEKTSNQVYFPRG